MTAAIQQCHARFARIDALAVATGDLNNRHRTVSVTADRPVSTLYPGDAALQPAIEEMKKRLKANQDVDRSKVRRTPKMILRTSFDSARQAWMRKSKNDGGSEILALAAERKTNYKKQAVGDEDEERKRRRARMKRAIHFQLVFPLSSFSFFCSFSRSRSSLTVLKGST